MTNHKYTSIKLNIDETSRYKVASVCSFDAFAQVVTLGWSVGSQIVDLLVLSGIMPAT